MVFTMDLELLQISVKNPPSSKGNMNNFLLVVENLSSSLLFLEGLITDLLLKLVFQLEDYFPEQKLLKIVLRDLFSKALPILLTIPVIMTIAIVLTTFHKKALILLVRQPTVWRPILQTIRFLSRKCKQIKNWLLLVNITITKNIQMLLADINRNKC